MIMINTIQKKGLSMSIGKVPDTTGLVKKDRF